MIESLRMTLKIVERHWMVYRKNLISNSSTTISDPLFFILAFGFGLGAYVQDVNGRSYLEFMAPGLAAGAALFTSFFECAYSSYFRLNFDGTFKGMLTSPIGVREIVMGELLWVAIKGAVMMTGISLVMACFGFVNWSGILIVPLVGALIGIGCGAIGLIAITLIKSIDQLQIIYSAIIAPIYFLSGIFFPVSSDNSFLYSTVQISPLYHGVQLSQNFLWGEEPTISLLYHGCLQILITGILAFVAVQRMIQKLYMI